MKHIILSTIFFLLFGIKLMSQSFCDPNGISTNPDNPINNHNTIFLNDFFDWRNPSFGDYFKTGWLDDHDFPYTNPYHSELDYLSYLSGYSDGIFDYYTNEGWELICRNFGKYHDGTDKMNLMVPIL